MHTSGIAGPDLQVWTGRTAASLLVEGRSVRGVVLADGEVVHASAVVVAAGTVGTARLLRDTGRVPGAGRWLKNHAAAMIGFPWPGGGEVGQGARVHRLARWTGAPSKTEDVQTGSPAVTSLLMGPFSAEAGASGAVIVMMSSVKSSGRLDLAADPARLVTNRLSHPADLARLREAVRAVVPVCRALVDVADADRDNTDRQVVEELDRMTDADLDDWLRLNPGPVYHAVGSARMGGPEVPGSVTRAEPGVAGTVRGLDGVTVVDASVFPELVAGGLQFPVVAVAERLVSETLLGPSDRLGIAR